MDTVVLVSAIVAMWWRRCLTGYAIVLKVQIVGIPPVIIYHKHMEMSSDARSPSIFEIPIGDTLWFLGSSGVILEIEVAATIGRTMRFDRRYTRSTCDIASYAEPVNPTVFLAPRVVTVYKIQITVGSKGATLRIL